MLVCCMSWVIIRMENNKMQEQNNKMPSQSELRDLELKAIEKSEKGDRSYRKKYRQMASPITCYDCGKIFTTLRTVPDPTPRSTFKRGTHKKIRNKLPLRGPDGNIVYICNECIRKRAKGLKK